MPNWSAVGCEGAIKQWDATDGKEVRQFDAPVLHVFDKVFRADIGARGMAFSSLRVYTMGPKG